MGTNSDAGWRFYGSIQHSVISETMSLSFPSTVDGWMRQFRAVYSLPAGLKMGSSVDIQNPDPVTKTFRFIMRDSDLTNNYSCVFNHSPECHLCGHIP